MTAPGLNQYLSNPQVISAELARRSLRRFAEDAWPLVEPGRAFISNWHIDAICEHLEAVTSGQIQNLLINMPPRCMKSLLVTVFWPAWHWVSKPETRWLFSSYALQLSIRDSVKCRRLIESPWYQYNWGEAYELTSDQNAKQRYENDRTGVRLATSVDGSATGEGGDFIVVDDPHNVREAESQLQREAVLVWWDEVMATRLNSPTGGKVIVMQRVHEDDLSGHVLESKLYEHLMLPMEFEPSRRCYTSIGWQDPRLEQGELLWPDRFPTKAISQIRTELGSYGYACQYQQSPAPREGGLFKIERFQIVDTLPSEPVAIVRAWDKAGTDSGGDYSVGVKFARLKNKQYAILDVVRGQWSVAKREAIMRKTAEVDGAKVRIWMEQEPGSSGKESSQASILNLAGFVARAERATGDKAVRAEQYAVQVEAGNVFLLRDKWNREFIDEHRFFPKGKNDDQVDAASLAFNKLRRNFSPVWGR